MMAKLELQKIEVNDPVFEKWDIPVRVHAPLSFLNLSAVIEREGHVRISC